MRAVQTAGRLEWRKAEKMEVMTADLTVELLARRLVVSKAARWVHLMADLKVKRMVELKAGPWAEQLVDMTAEWWEGWRAGTTAVL